MSDTTNHDAEADATLGANVRLLAQQGLMIYKTSSEEWVVTYNQYKAEYQRNAPRLDAAVEAAAQAAAAGGKEGEQ